MSDFKLDVDSPYEIPKRESLEERPNIMPYPKSKIRFGHYGQYTQKVLESVGTMTEEEKEYVKKKMGNFMKKQFLVHNNSAVENNVIAEQLNELSQGQLKIENPDDLVSTNQMLRSLGIQTNPGANNKNNNNNRRPGGGNGNNNNNNRKKQNVNKKFKK